MKKKIKIPYEIQFILAAAFTQAIFIFCAWLLYYVMRLIGR